MGVRRNRLRRPTLFEVCSSCLALTIAVLQGQPSGQLAAATYRPIDLTPTSWSRTIHKQWNWLQLSGEFRSRAEGPTGLNFLDGSDEVYAMTRLRLNATATLRPWLRVAGEWQDSHAPGLCRPRAGSMEDRFDLRQAYAEVGTPEGKGMGIRVGRQSLKYGKGRLVWDPDWGNTGQAFDAIRFSLKAGHIRWDAFAASVVVPQNRAADRSVTSNMLYGIYTSIDRWGKRLRLEPYAFLKSNARVRNELLQYGALDVYTMGGRAAGAWSAALDYELEMAYQSGRQADRPVRAFGGVWLVGWQTGPGKRSPRLSAGYTYGSGDSNPKDGQKGTFDTLYPSTHLRNGATDRIGWANIEDWTGQADWKLPHRLKLSVGGHEFRLATLADALYSRSGTPLVRKADASSRRIGAELFTTVEYPLGESVTLGAGYAHLFRGAFLIECHRGSATQPYVFLSYRF